MSKIVPIGDYSGGFTASVSGGDDADPNLA